MLLFTTINHHTAVRLAEVGAALTALAGLLFVLGGMTPFMRRGGMILGGLALLVAGILLVVAMHWGYFGA